MFAVITDSAANLTEVLLEKHRIVSADFPLLLGGIELPSINELDPHEYYSALRGGVRVQTSQVSPEQYRVLMERGLQEGLDVLCITLSSGVSGSFQSASIAAEELREAYPERKICVVDSLGASLGEGLLVLEAAGMRDNGVSVEEAVKKLRAMRHRMCQIFTVDDLKYLRTTGRLSYAKTAIAGALHFKPLLKGDREGRIVAFGVTRGRRRAIEALAEHFSLYAAPDTGLIGISHADCAPDALALASLLRGQRPQCEILTVCHEPVTGAHVGPGMLALYFLGDRAFRGGESRA